MLKITTQQPADIPLTTISLDVMYEQKAFSIDQFQSNVSDGSPLLYVVLPPINQSPISENVCLRNPWRIPVRLSMTEVVSTDSGYFLSRILGPTVASDLEICLYTFVQTTSSGNSFLKALRISSAYPTTHGIRARLNVERRRKTAL